MQEKQEEQLKILCPSFGLDCVPLKTYKEDHQ